jgi:hypothetical protein
MTREIDVPKTTDELFFQIIEMSGVDPTLVPQGKGFCWFGNYDEQGRLGPPMIFKWGERSPFNKRMGIVAMFQNDVEARIYAVPLEKPEKNEEVAFTRHTLTKTAPTFFFEVLPPDVFQAEIADELAVLASETASPESFSEELESEQGKIDETKDETADEQTSAPVT